MKRSLIVIFPLALVFSFSPLHSVVKADEQTPTTTMQTTDVPTTPAPTDQQSDQTSTTNSDQGTTGDQPSGQQPTNDKTSGHHHHKGNGSDNGQSQGTDNNQTGDQTSGDNSSSTPTSDVQLEVHRTISQNGYLLKASLPKSVSHASGTWTFVVDGKQVHQETNQETSATYELAINTDTPKGYSIQVTFEGTADGKAVKLTQDASIPELKLEADSKSNFTATIVGGKDAEGMAAIIVSDENGDIIDMYENDDLKGLTFSHTFNPPPGKYIVSAYYAGIVDGEETGLVQYVTLDVQGQDNGGSIKPPPSDYKPTKPVSKQTVVSIIKNSKKGGQLPKTATSYPTSLAFGVVLLVLGATLLGYRRFAQQQ